MKKLSNLCATFVLMLGIRASGQELLKNGNFEASFPGTNPYTNWVLVYAEGGPSDFSIAGQSTEASRGGGGRGAHIRPNNFNYCHAYFSQIVTNLTEGTNYQLTAQKMIAGFQNYIDGDKLRIYMTLISGPTTNEVYGDATAIGPYTNTITVDSSHRIEVQLHLWKSFMSNESPEDMKHAKCSGWFDDFSLTLIP